MERHLAFVLALVIPTLVVASGTAASAEPRLFKGVPIMPGGHVAEDSIVYPDGVVVVPAGVGIEAFDSCPSGKVCLFADPNWAGNMVQFSTCCAWVNLSNYGFNNTASSWRNRLNVDAQIADGAGGVSPRLCLNNGSYSSSMPSGWNNAASSIRVRDGAGYC